MKEQKNKITFEDWLNKFEMVGDLLWLSKDGLIMRDEGSMKELYNNLKK